MTKHVFTGNELPRNKINREELITALKNLDQDATLTMIGAGQIITNGKSEEKLPGAIIVTSASREDIAAILTQHDPELDEQEADNQHRKEARIAQMLTLLEDSRILQAIKKKLQGNE
jgi:hypothetical protein